MGPGGPAGGQPPRGGIFGGGGGGGGGHYPTTFPEVEAWKKGVRRYIDDYPEFTKEALYYQWRREFIIVAALHETGCIMIPSYVPQTAAEIELFRLKQNYMFVVFTKKLKVPYSVMLLQRYAGCMDAQQFNEKHDDYFRRSASANLLKNSLRSFLMSARLDVVGWNDSYVAWVNYIMKKIQEYQEMCVNTPDELTDEFQMTLIINSVSNVPELHSLKTQLDMTQMIHGHTPTYEHYTQLLLAQATALDEARLTQEGYRSPAYRRFANTHDVSDTHDVEEIDDDLVRLEINEAGRRPASNPNRPRVPIDRWNQLSQQDRATWDQLDDRAKAILLGLSSSNPSRTANFGEQLRAFAAVLDSQDDDDHGTGDDDSPDVVNDGEDEAGGDNNDGNDDQLLVMAASRAPTQRSRANSNRSRAPSTRTGARRPTTRTPPSRSTRFAGDITRALSSSMARNPHLQEAQRAGRNGNIRYRTNVTEFHTEEEAEDFHQRGRG